MKNKVPNMGVERRVNTEDGIEIYSHSCNNNVCNE